VPPFWHGIDEHGAKNEVKFSKIEISLLFHSIERNFPKKSLQYLKKPYKLEI